MMTNDNDKPARSGRCAPPAGSRSDTERLEFLLRFLSVEDVGDEDFIPGVVVNPDALEEAIGMSEANGDNLHCFVGHTYPAADGGNYGIYVVGCIPEKNDLVVMTVAGGKVRYDEEPRRLDAFKASYRYKLSLPNAESEASQ